MATLIDNTAGEWTANEVLQLDQTMQIEGAATGASFGGIGNVNQPHQQLANRTAFLYNQQQTDKANIAALQGQVTVLIEDHGVQVFASSGPFIVPANVTRLTRVRLWGGAAGGGASSTSVAGAGGGAGAYCEYSSMAVTPGANMPVTIGAGGAGGSVSSGAAGGGGGTSQFGPMNAQGGFGGTGWAADPSAGGIGGTGTGGTFNISGEQGTAGMRSADGMGGRGGSASGGGGGGAASTGQPGLGMWPGGGGAGGGSGNSWPGGAGSGGACIIEW